MITIQIHDLVTLREHFAAVEDGALFRGQTRHYEDQEGAPIINTSFDRKGCVPAAMIKWQHYAKEILRILAGPNAVVPDHLADAILQHYGWRSFYVDVTKSAAVAAWFASHTYTSGTVMEMAEDVNEAFVMPVHKAPIYVPSEQPGSIYVISGTKAKASDATFVDLTGIECEDTNPRFHAQQGGLIGPCSRISPAAVLERWEVPASVLREFASEDGLETTENLFPPREDDFFLTLLTAVPWVHATNDAGLPIFRRGLDIPEYDHRSTHRYSANTAFCRHTWLSRGDHLGRTPLLGTAVRFGMEEETFYYHVDPPVRGFGAVVKALDPHPVIVVEIDGLVRGPERYQDDEYTKGVVIHRITDNLVQIGELAVRHPGIVIAGIRVLSPWTYRITTCGDFVRQAHEHDCPCNNHGRHEHLLRYVQAFELLLGEGAFEQVADLEYRHRKTAAASLHITARPESSSLRDE